MPRFLSLLLITTVYLVERPFPRLAIERNETGRDRLCFPPHTAWGIYIDSYYINQLCRSSHTDQDFKIKTCSLIALATVSTFGRPGLVQYPSHRSLGHWSPVGVESGCQ